MIAIATSIGNVFLIILTSRCGEPVRKQPNGRLWKRNKEGSIDNEKDRHLEGKGTIMKKHHSSTGRLLDERRQLQINTRYMGRVSSEEPKGRWDFEMPS